MFRELARLAPDQIIFSSSTVTVQWWLGESNPLLIRKATIRTANCTIAVLSNTVNSAVFLAGPFGLWKDSSRSVSLPTWQPIDQPCQLLFGDVGPTEVKAYWLPLDNATESLGYNGLTPTQVNFCPKSFVTAPVRGKSISFHYLILLSEELPRHTARMLQNKQNTWLVISLFSYRKQGSTISCLAVR